MSGRALIAVALALAFLGWLAAQCGFVVSDGQQALVTRFGQPLATLTTSGLYFKAPLTDSVTFYETRLIGLQPPMEQLILGDQKRIEVTTYARFRIVDPLRFYQSVGTVDQVRLNLAQIMSSAVRKQLGAVALPALLTDERDRITDRLRDDVARRAVDLGVNVTDVRILRAELPAETSQAIYDRMTSDRVREAKELRAEGFEQAQQIRSRADKDREVLLADAQRGSQTERGEADAEADRIATDAFAKDPAFYDFYRSMQVYRASLTGGSTLVLSPDNQLLKYFDAGPAVPGPKAAP